MTLMKTGLKRLLPDALQKHGTGGAKKMPNRIIKESLCINEKIASLSDFEFRLWIGLIVSVDDYGRGDARPAVIKGRVFPFRDRVTLKEIDAALHSLAAKGCVSLYIVDGKPYFWFPTWGKHQRIRTKVSKYPEPQVAADCGNSPQNVANGSRLSQVAADCGLNPESGIQNPEYEEDADAADSVRARDPELVRAVEYYQRLVNPALGHMEADELTRYTAQYGADLVIFAVDKALAANKRTWAYIRGIIRGWERQGVKTLADAQRLDADFEAQKQAKQSASRQTRASARPKKTTFADMAKQAMWQEKPQEDIIEADWSEVP